jgi:hypothetical protein
MKPRAELRLAPELAQSHAELRKRLLSGVASVLRVRKQVRREPLHPRGVPLAERRERPAVTVFRSLDQDGITQLLVDERPLGPRVLPNLTALAQRRLHGGPSLRFVPLPVMAFEFSVASTKPEAALDRGAGWTPSQGRG